MAAFEDRVPPWLRPEHDALVSRLRQLEWTEVKPELRERCWDQFRDRLAGNPGAARPVTRTGERYAFTRRQDPSELGPVAESRARIAGAASKRGTLSLA